MPMPFCQSVAQQVFLTLSQNVYGCGSTYKLLVRVAPVRVMTMVDKKCMVQENLCRATKCMARLGLSSWARGRHGALTSMQNNSCFIDNRVLAISCAWASVASITYQPHGSHLRVSCCENASQKSTSKHSGQVQTSSAFHGATAKSL